MGRTRSNTSFGDTKPAPRVDLNKGQRSLRSKAPIFPTCLDFGVNIKRKVLHPTGYFCWNCKWYEDAIMSGSGGNKVKQDSQRYACRANHYDWAYPREKWTVIGNHFMSANEIRSEEARLQQEEIANARASRKRRHEAISISDVLEDDGEDNMVEKAALEDAGQEVSVITDKANGGLCSDADDTDACEVAVSPAVVFNVNDNAIAGIDNNHPQITLDRLREQVAQLENTVV